MAAMAHGQIALSWRAQPFGVMLFVVVLAIAAVGTVELVADRPVLHKLRPGLWWVWLLAGGLLAGWGIKALTGYLAGRYPLP